VWEMWQRASDGWWLQKRWFADGTAMTRRVDWWWD
jgi:hypothetical protein